MRATRQPPTEPDRGRRRAGSLVEESFAQRKLGGRSERHSRREDRDLVDGIAVGSTAASTAWPASWWATTFFRQR